MAATETKILYGRRDFKNSDDCLSFLLEIGNLSSDKEGWEKEAVQILKMQKDNVKSFSGRLKDLVAINFYSWRSWGNSEYKKKVIAALVKEFNLPDLWVRQPEEVCKKAGVYFDWEGAFQSSVSGKVAVRLDILFPLEKKLYEFFEQESRVSGIGGIRSKFASYKNHGRAQFRDFLTFYASYNSEEPGFYERIHPYVESEMNRKFDVKARQYDNQKLPLHCKSLIRNKKGLQEADVLAKNYSQVEMLTLTKVDFIPNIILGDFPNLKTLKIELKYSSMWSHFLGAGFAFLRRLRAKNEEKIHIICRFQHMPELKELFPNATFNPL